MIWRSELNSWSARLLDVCTVVIGSVLTIYEWNSLYAIYPQVFPHPITLDAKENIFLIVTIAVFQIGLLSKFGAYSYLRFTSLSKEIGIILKSLAITFLLSLLLYFLILHRFVLSRTNFLLFFINLIFLFIVQKYLLFQMAAWLRKRGKNRKKILVIGTGTRAQKFLEIIREHFHWGLDVIGLLTGDQEKINQYCHGIKVLGTYENIEEILRQWNPEEVMVTVSTKRFDKLRDVLEVCEREGVPVRLNSDFFGRIAKHVTLDSVYGLNIISFNTTHPKQAQQLLKRFIDFLGALAALLIFSPFMVTAAIGILLSDGRPILYKWNVVGYNKKPFQSWKFRTMVRNADALKNSLIDKNEMSGPVFKINDDPRIFSFGRWLRKWSIDEIPQLFSVIKGDMSLVGPRPAGIDELPNYESWQRRRLSVKPGMTCIWQVSGRNGISDFNKWVKLDLEYIDNWSLWLDIKILCQTIPAVITKKGAS